MLLLVFIARIQASAETNATEDSRFNLKAFQTGAVYTFQGSGFSGGGMFRYIPSYEINETFAVGLSLDLALMKLASNTNFAAIGYMTYVRMKAIDKLNIAFNVGAQTWTCKSCGTKLLLGTNISYDITMRNCGWLKNIWLAYLPTFRDPVVHEFQLGVGLQF